jgi:serine phosphatase RsbU (regulator of sigma subunit)
LLTHGETDPVHFLDTLNRTLYGNVQRRGGDKNLTLTLLDYTAGEVRLSGQHEEILVIRRKGTVEQVETVALEFPIGLVGEIAGYVKHQTVRLHPGDGVVLYTDGITEAENAAGKQYGLERLCAVMRQHWGSRPRRSRTPWWPMCASMLGTTRCTTIFYPIFMLPN